MPKKFSVRAKDLTTEEIFGLLRQMPKRPLLNLASIHKLETTPETVAMDLAHARAKCLSTVTFNIGFQL